MQPISLMPPWQQHTFRNLAVYSMCRYGVWSTPVMLTARVERQGRGRAGQNRARQGRAAKAGQGWAGQGRAVGAERSGRAGQRAANAGQGWTEEDRAGRAGRGRAGQGRPGRATDPSSTTKRHEEAGQLHTCLRHHNFLLPPICLYSSSSDSQIRRTGTSQKEPELASAQHQTSDSQMSKCQTRQVTWR